MTRAPNPALLAAAVEHHRAGRLDRAAALYRDVLAADPDDVDALHLLGVLEHQRGDREAAVARISRAVALRPDHVQAHFNLGGALEALGRLDAAAASYRRALALDPGYERARASLAALEALRNVDAWLDEAVAHQRAGRLAEAEARFRAVLEVEPDNFDALHLFGVVAHRTGRDRLAVELIGRALALDPDFAQAHNNLGLILQVMGRLDEAEAHGMRAVVLDPAYAEAHTNLGNTLKDRRRFDEAEDCHRRALVIRPDYGEGWTNLGAVHELRGEAGRAVACHRRALAFRPDLPDAHNNLGTALLALDRRDEALASFEATLARDGDFALAHWNRGLLRLGRGELAEGWPEYDWRFRARQLQQGRTPPVPAWRGEELSGRRILVWREQGVGDELMFAACYPELIARAGHVVIECDPRLVPLFARSFPQATVRAPGLDAQGRETLAPGEADVHVAAGSLPRVLCPDLTAFVPHRGYLVADPERMARWRERLAALGKGPKIGICWRSQTLSADRNGHYTGLRQWQPVLTVPGVKFVNLQYDRCEDEIADAEHRFGIGIARWADLDLRNDFEGVAALMASLDLVITGPTSVGELAGALGVPVWRLACGGDWSALGTGCRPWYPSMRLVYARTAGPLADKLVEVAGDLTALLAARPVPTLEERLEQAAAHHRAGRFDRAAPLYRDILAIDPEQPVALHLFGLLAHQLGNHEVAADLIGRAVAAAPDYAAAHLNHGLVLQALGRAEEAVAACRRALALNPEAADALTNLGNALAALGRLDEAEDCHRRALALAPDLVPAHTSLGAVLQARHRLDEAAACQERALALRPDEARAHANLVTIRRLQGRYDAAVEAGRRALALTPGDAETWSGFALALHSRGDAEEAAAGFDRALDLAPDLAPARLNRALLRLGQGGLDAGWADYAARFAATGHDPGRRFAVPEWQGEPLKGRRLMVWREQGLGDELMFAACYPDLARLDGPVILECDPRLVGLFARSFPARSFPGVQVRAERPGTDGTRSDFDRHVAAGSLPRLVRPSLAAFPGAPYLVADPDRVAAWRERLATLGPGLRVGLGWRSALLTGGRAAAYAGLDRWAPVLGVPGLSFVNLQYDRCEDEITAIERRFGVTVARWPDLDLKNDLEGVAALVSNLDLVITAATAVGELAGALGVPVWRVAGGGDWTVLGSRARPWFPTMRLFYTRTGETLDDVLARVAAALTAPGTP